MKEPFVVGGHDLLELVQVARLQPPQGVHLALDQLPQLALDLYQGRTVRVGFAQNLGQEVDQHLHVVVPAEKGRRLRESPQLLPK